MTVETTKGKQDSRVNFYENAKRDLDDYWIMGVGAGNYFRKWGFEKGYDHETLGVRIVYGVHNGFLQVLIFWGIIGLLPFLAIIFQAYCCVPKRCGSDPLALALLGLAVSILSLIPFTHNIESKVFTLGLGMLVAYQRWIASTNSSQLESR
jgi:O-antigen ligase